jgi:shikimate dehydrogenase
MTELMLGLIGDNIARSQSPRLHRLAGAQAGMDVRYDRLVPADLGQTFDEVFLAAREAEFDGLNITYPYKERVVPKVTLDDPVIRAIGAVNTIVFDETGPKGFNTDYTGFKAAYAGVRGDDAPGATLLIGTGGVGRAIAFGLADLGAAELRLIDRDLAKADALAADLGIAFPGLRVTTGVSATEAASGASGIVNCTPVGMVGHDGTPLPSEAMRGADWAFDAVYTPVQTQFLTNAGRCGLQVISGWELFFFQGAHAWRLFSGKDADLGALRRALLSEGSTP